MPNAFAYLMLFGWPVVAWLLFRRLPPGQAAVATIIWGYLLLPERLSIDPPLLPAIDKYFVPSLSASVLLWVHNRSKRRQPAQASDGGTSDGGRKRRRAAPSRGAAMPWIVLGVLAASSLFTGLSNDYPLVYGPKVLPAMRIYDGFSLMLSYGVTLLPLLLAQRYLAGKEIQLFTLRTLAWAGLVYSLLILFEIRMSPKLNIDIYGFFPQSYAQHYRSGGWRPIVFLQHGLRVGIFMAMAVLAAATLYRISSGKMRMQWLLATLWLLAILSISKNLGAFLICLALLPFALRFSPRLAQLGAMLIAVVILAYPMARGAGMIPTNWVVTQIQKISIDRAESFEFRLINEDKLLAKANMKPISGWGSWSRNRVYNPESGADISTTDGTWIILIGVSGWVGYLSLFGLLCLPIIFLWRRYGKLRLSPIDVGLSLILVANLADLIPNSSLVPITWLIAGLLWARLTHRDADWGTHSEEKVSKRSQARSRKKAEPSPATS